MDKKIKIGLLAIFALGFFITIVSPVLAAPSSCGGNSGVEEVGWLKTIIPPDGLIIPCQCLSSETVGVDRCGLTQIFQTIVNFSKLILALTGSVALAMFMIGGIWFIVSYGNQERITKGKETMKAAAIGIIIILGSWVVVNFTIYAVTGGDVGSIYLFDQPWAQEQDIRPIQGPEPPPSSD